MEPKISYLELLKPFHIKPRNELYYIEALTHSSYAHESHMSSLKDYEKLEFMGDAVFQLVSAELIYNTYPEKTEGELTKLRSKLVRTESFAKLGRELQIHEMMYLGHGEEKDRGKKDKIIENVVEAFIGAIFVDRGYKIARIVARRWLLQILSELKEDDVEDYKSELQELIQSDSREPLKYELVMTEGKDNNKIFYYKVSHDGIVLGEGKGKSKKAAEQEAAKVALSKLAK